MSSFFHDYNVHRSYMLRTVTLGNESFIDRSQDVEEGQKNEFILLIPASTFEAKL